MVEKQVDFSQEKHIRGGNNERIMSLQITNRRWQDCSYNNISGSFNRVTCEKNRFKNPARKSNKKKKQDQYGSSASTEAMTFWKRKDLNAGL